MPPGGSKYNPLTDKGLWVLTVICVCGALILFGKVDDVLAWFSAFISR